MSEKYFITTAISYPNGTPHIGHGYELMATDALARFQRLDGKDVFFLTGTDEHGIKMLQTAREQGVSPRELADRNTARFQAMTEALGASNDDFIRTTEDRHKRTCQAIWERMAANGDIYKDAYAGWYSVRDEAYYDEDETNVADDDGVRYGPQGTPVEWVEEESYFFRLSAYQDKLLKLYEDQPDFIGPDSRKNEIVAFVKRGLNDLSVSRTTFDWGIPVPGDEKHVMYVWVDALTNYLTATGWPDEHARNHYWPADVHVIGKDITRFHAIYWPAFLMSAGLELPSRVFGHGFLFNKGEKMSKSIGNVVDPFDLTAHYGLDQVRYFFLREVPFGNDGSYSHEAIVARTNADLANGLGNLAQRSLSMIAKNCDGKVPSTDALNDDDRSLLAMAAPALEKARDAMAKQAVHTAIEAAFEIVDAANKYIDTQAPWVLRKTDPERMEAVLYTVADTVRSIAILMQPVMPQACAKLLDLVAVPQDKRQFSDLGEVLVSGTPLPAPEGVFPRYVAKEPEA